MADTMRVEHHECLFQYVLRLAANRLIEISPFSGVSEIFICRENHKYNKCWRLWTISCDLVGSKSHVACNAIKSCWECVCCINRLSMNHNPERKTRNAITGFSRQWVKFPLPVKTVSVFRIWQIDWYVNKNTINC